MLKIKIKDLIIIGLIVIIAFYFTFEIYKIKHQLKFATLVNQVNSSTVWIQNFSQSLAQAQQRATQSQVPQQPAKKPGKEVTKD